MAQRPERRWQVQGRLHEEHVPTGRDRRRDIRRRRREAVLVHDVEQHVEDGDQIVAPVGRDRAGLRDIAGDEPAVGKSHLDLRNRRVHKVATIHLARTEVPPERGPVARADADLEDASRRRRQQTLTMQERSEIAFERPI